MGQDSAHLAAFSLSPSGLSNVTLLTGDVEALGHGFYIDEKTVDGAMKLLLGKPVAAYLTHAGGSSDRLGQEIGFFSGIYREGLKLKAKSFEFLESFRRSSGDVVARLSEMAQKFPDQFGLSPVIRYSPVWVMPDGSEVPAKLGEKPPAGAVRALPSARIGRIESVDFVKTPAANPNGLLSEKPAAVDEPAKQQALTMSQEITAALEAQKKELSEANTAAISAALAKAGDEHKATLAALVTQHEAALTKANDEHKAALEAANVAHKAELAKKDADHAAVVEDFKNKLARAEELSAAKLGIPPLVLTHAANVMAALPAPAKTDAEKWDQYTALAATDPAKAEHFRKAYLSK